MFIVVSRSQDYKRLDLTKTRPSQYIPLFSRHNYVYKAYMC